MPLPPPVRPRRLWYLVPGAVPWCAALLPLLLPALLLRREGGIGVGATFNFEGLDSDYYRRSALRPELDWHWGEAFRGIAVGRPYGTTGGGSVQHIGRACTGTVGLRGVACVCVMTRSLLALINKSLAAVALLMLVRTSGSMKYVTVSMCSM